MTWDMVIGLEVHAQLKTRSKLFSSSATKYGASANSQTNFIDAGLPGVLPVLNREAVHMAIKFGLAIDAEINDFSFFERKNYFYPDLPKGYQISQYQRPIVSNGHLDIILDTDQCKKVTIARAHLEEDAGKSLHENYAHYTGIDLNRAGTPLLEIVTTPCLFSAEEVVSYLKTLHQLLRFLDICDGNMQEGSFRCDVNLSLRRKGQEKLGTRTELKNLNSFRYIEKAIHYESMRQQNLLDDGQAITQETRLYSPASDTTHSLRTKENENDYRYFSDPDLLPISITTHDLACIRATMPILPAKIKADLQACDNLTIDEIDFLLSSPALLHYFEQLKEKSAAPVKLIINWLRGSYAAALNERGETFDKPPVTVEAFACLLDRLAENVISPKNAKLIFNQLINTNQTVDALIAQGNYQQVNHQQLEEIVRNLIMAYPGQVAEYRAGKEKLSAFFVGKIMQETKGQADPIQINTLLLKHLMPGENQ